MNPSFTVISDTHIGAKGCDFTGISEALRTASRQRDYIIINGDIFDAIVAGDPRYDASEIDPNAAKVADPINWCISRAMEIFKPHRSRIVAMTRGNHERTIIRRSGFDPASSLAKQLKVPYLGYCGFIPTEITGKQHPVYMHHGCGGFSTQFKKLGWVDASVIITGHHHQLRVDTAGRMNSAGKVRPVWHIQTPAWVSPSSHGYAAEAGYAPGVSSRAVRFVLHPNRIEVSL